MTEARLLGGGGLEGASTDPSAFAPAPMRGRHVYLRAIVPEDYRLLQQLDAGELGLRWRTRGATPSPEQWMQLTWNSVLAQFVVTRTSDRRALGVVMAYRPSFQDGHAQFAVVSLEKRRSPVLVLGCAIFLEYVFTCWNFHKLYMELPEWNLSQFASGLGKYFQIEGRLRNHLFYDGQHWDEIIMGLYRSTWRENGKRLLAAEQPGPSRPRVPRIRSLSTAGSDRSWK